MDEFTLVVCLPGAEETVIRGELIDLLEYARLHPIDSVWEIYRNSDEVLFAESHGRIVSEYSIEQLPVTR